MEFTIHTGQHNRPVGQFLGQFKDKLDGNDCIEEFCIEPQEIRLQDTDIKKMYAAESEAFHSTKVKEALDQPHETRVPKTCQIEHDAKKYEIYPFAQYYRLVFKIDAWSTLTRSRPIRMPIMIWIHETCNN